MPEEDGLRGIKPLIASMEALHDELRATLARNSAEFEKLTDNVLAAVANDSRGAERTRLMVGLIHSVLADCLGRGRTDDAFDAFLGTIRQPQDQPPREGETEMEARRRIQAHAMSMELENAILSVLGRSRPDSPT